MSNQTATFSRVLRKFLVGPTGHGSGSTNREIDYAARHLCEDLNHMQPVTLELQLKSRNVPPALESENGPAENPQEIILDSPSCKRLFLWDLRRHAFQRGCLLRPLQPHIFAQD